MSASMNRSDHIPVQITPYHLRISPAICEFTTAMIGSLTRISADAISADVVIRSNHGITFTASARVALPGRDIHAMATEANLYAAIMELESRLARRLGKRKPRLANHEAPAQSERGCTSAALLEASLVPA